MSVHSLASNYARFVVLGRLMYWTPPPPDQTIGPPLLKSDDVFLGNQEILDPPPFKNPGHAPGVSSQFGRVTTYMYTVLYSRLILNAGLNRIYLDSVN